MPGLQHGDEGLIRFSLLAIVLLVLRVDLVVKRRAFDRFASIGKENHGDEVRAVNHAEHIRKDRLHVRGFAVVKAFQILRRMPVDELRHFRRPDLQRRFPGVQFVIESPNADGIAVANLAVHIGTEQLLHDVLGAFGAAAHRRGSVKNQQPAIGRGWLGEGGGWEERCQE